MSGAREPEGAARTGGVQSVERAADVLRVLADRPHGATAVDVAAATGLDRTTVHRLLRTLVTTGLAESRGSSYVPGAVCTLLGAARLDSTRLHEIALPFAVDLQRNAVGERPLVVSISCCAQSEVVIVDRIWTPAVPLDIIAGIGWRFAIDQAVSGRAMLAAMPDDRIAALIGPARQARLASRLRAIRARGGIEFGVDEQRAGVATMACPLLGVGGAAVGALVIAGLGMQDDLQPDGPLTQALARSAALVSQRLRIAA